MYMMSEISLFIYKLSGRGVSLAAAERLVMVTKLVLVLVMV